jgi:hypothetical protein
MRAAYEKMDGYTIVLTPHAIESWVFRFARVITKDDVIFTIDDVHHKLPLGTVAGTDIEVDNRVIAYIYMRRIWNEQRDREEVEFISITPANHFNTGGRNENGVSHQNTLMV